MIPLRGRAVSTNLSEPLKRRVWLLEDAGTYTNQRRGRALILDSSESVPTGFGLYLSKGGAAALDGNLVELPAPLHHLGAGDIVSLSADGERINVLWRANARQNSILLTERCNHYCLMCSQPPKDVNDDQLLDNAFELVRLLPSHTPAIGFTGGEPTLYGESLIDLLQLCRNLLPYAGVHVLSNGRRFSDFDFAAAWAGIDNPNLMVGIPIYGTEPSLHDYVVQSRGAFDSTMRGILNLGRLRQRIEIRVVIHKQTAPYLVEIADFISRNLPFVDQVALMGLEMIGFARANMDDVWIDPIEYRDALTEAVLLLDRKRVPTMVYNHQLCLIDRRIWRFAVQSISDWKNEYHPECLACSVADRCGGFFFSAKYRISDHIKAISDGDGDRQRALLQLATDA
jgi:His-Xaa-Ser system radical SAM maturase HxsC